MCLLLCSDINNKAFTSKKYRCSLLLNTTILYYIPYHNATTLDSLPNLSLCSMDFSSGKIIQAENFSMYNNYIFCRLVYRKKDMGGNSWLFKKSFTSTRHVHTKHAFVIIGGLAPQNSPFEGTNTPNVLVINLPMAAAAATFCFVGYSFINISYTTSKRRPERDIFYF